MWMYSKQTAKPRAAATSKAVGDGAEDHALAYLRGAGLRLLERNFRTPGRGGGEIDLIMREPDGTVVFVEVRWRRSNAHGGAAASVTHIKRQRLVLAARHYLLRLTPLPPCRFDVVLVSPSDEAASASASGGSAAPVVEWLRAAFVDGGAT